MPQDADEVAQIAIALNRRAWLPSQEEQVAGQAVMARVDGIGETRRPPMPPRRVTPLPGIPGSDVIPWTTQIIVRLAAVVPIVDEVLAAHRPRLPAASPMVTLLSGYAKPGRDLTALARRLEDAWHATPPPLPGWQAITDEALYRKRPSADAWQLLAEASMTVWEERHLTADDRERCQRAGRRMGAVGATITAALTGDVDW